ncbi:MAG: hypothetical protein ACLSHU_08870 [Oscillospiraceae bacterium]
MERRKLRRYDAGQLLTLNREKLDTQGRECKVCGRMDRLVDLAGQNEPPDLRCPWCKRFWRCLSSWWNGMCMWCTGPWRKRRRPTYQP